MADLFSEDRLAKLQVGSMPTDVYARQVVTQTLKRHVKAWIWKGSFSFVCWFIDTFFGRTGFDLIFSSESGLNRLKNKLSKKKKQN
ncbi:hypothetical protein DFH07DRAFT_850226 [Mycena maculata]|uniref:Uncharacterized protein n=1 Tax=Mycena maculata TaxID=230809 RepID=A0AAD7HXA3_9AGAR|nr:hypothetical protein DFH07DRAFT_850226 [Mycena maculata]